MNGVLHNSLFIRMIHGFYWAGNGGLEYDGFFQNQGVGHWIARFETGGIYDTTGNLDSPPGVSKSLLEPL
ncbi:hypothetical protein [Aeromonas enteropelogenes]|uniref:hypothetical protein n=1 Tax=Aeromonas enteropelogenes TaxID=29489 RepID=UPI000F53A218|nr:hypothetical protein [Aeromonas enteropelogenes]RQM64796.1 hypothetical protein EHZ64_10420 [Aeromonas enteropelogenes]